MSLTLSPHIQKMYDQAKAARSNRPKVGAPKRGASSRRATRCTILHEGERITFDLSKASTCPHGFMSIAKGVYIKPTGKPEKKAAPKAAKPKKTRAKKAVTPKTPKTKKARAKKAAAPKKSNGKKKRSPAQIAATKRMLAARKASLKKR